MSRIVKLKTSIPSAGFRTQQRARLHRRLYACMESPVTLISAPAGFGKTTLVADWATSGASERLVAWVSLDAKDRNGLRLLHHVLTALRRHHPGLSADVGCMLDRGLDADPTDLLAYLLEDLRDWAVPVLVVLDDFHTVDSPAMARALRFAVQHLPDTVRLVLVARRRPSLPLASWRSRGWLSEIGSRDLRFDVADVHALCRVHGMSMGTEDALALHESTGGWPAIVQLAMSVARHRGQGADSSALDGEGAAFSGRHPYAMEFFEAEVLHGLPARLLAFLHACGLLEQVNASLCAAVTGEHDAAALIERLFERHLLEAIEGQEPGLYRVPQVLREALRPGLAVASATQFHMRAAAWHEQQGNAVCALDHALAAGDIDACVRLLSGTVDHALETGNVHAFLARLETLPDQVLLENVDLTGCKAWLLCLIGRSAEAHRYAELAMKQQRRPDDCVYGAVLDVFRAYYELNWGNPRAAVDAARSALAHLAPESVSLRILAGSFIGQALVMTGRPNEAIPAWRAALQLGHGPIGRPTKAIDVLFHLVPLLLAQGQLREARVLCEDAVQQHRNAHGQADGLSGPVHAVHALVLHELHELTAAREAAERGLALCRARGVVYYELHALRVLARIQWALGERELAWGALARARERLLVAHSPRRAGVVELLAAELHVAAGQIQPALQALGHPGFAAGHADVNIGLLRAKAMLLQHKPQLALQLLGKLDETAREQGFDGTRILTEVLQARCWQLIGNKPAERRCLERALVLASFNGARKPLLEEGEPLLETMATLSGIAAQVVSMFPAGGTARAAVSAAGEAAPPALLDPLTKRDVEVLSLLDRGYRNQEIAEELEITIGTTKQYVNRLFAKLGVRNRVEAVSIGRRMQLLRP